MSSTAIREALKRARPYVSGQFNGLEDPQAVDVLDMIDAALSDQAQQAEPVAWLYTRKTDDANPIVSRWRWSADHHGHEFWDEYPLYRAAPQAPEAAQPGVSEAARDVLAERRRQIMAEGWTPEHDDEHEGGDMAYAAAVYALAANGINARRYWPWHANGWIKDAMPRRNLVKAGALIVAEIERLDRAALAAQAGSKTP